LEFKLKQVPLKVRRLTFLKTPNEEENIIQLKIVLLDPDLKDEAKKDDDKNYYLVIQ
jgi:hypothetical protein